MAAGDITAKRGKASDFKGAVFDGVDDYVIITSGQPDINTSFSITANIIRLKKMGSTIFTSRDRSDGNEGIFFKLDTVLELHKSGVTVIGQSTSNVTEGEWTNVGVSYDGTTVKFYINGAPAGTTARAATFTHGNFMIGDRNSVAADNPIKGFINNLKFHNRILTDQEFLDISNNKYISNNKLIAHWKLQDDYKDSVGAADGTNNGTYLTNTIPNRLMADTEELNLAAVTDKIIALPRTERDGQFTIVGANREA